MRAPLRTRPRLALVAASALQACASSNEPAVVMEVDVPTVDVRAVVDARAALDAGSDAPTDPNAAVDVAAPVDEGAAAPADAPTLALDAPAPCPAGQVVCEGVCTAIRVDARHCGACGQACAGGERCEDGVCRLVCPAGQSPCVGADGAAACATLATDRSHCGACGIACTTGQLCAAGRCTLSCASGEATCTPPGGAATCANLQTDAAHCGTCNRACSATERCIAGACVSSCAPSETACAGLCVDITRSDAHCGACGRACADGQTCVAGACRPRCAAPAVLCGDQCDDVTVSARNCGACGQQCPAGQSCVTGRCLLVCPTGQLVCNGACFDLQTDPANCGVCGRRCATGAVCRAGLCEGTCGAGQTSCSGACVVTATDANHCGGCGRLCEARTNSAASCAAGRCVWTCRAGSGDCDGNPLNGCEASLASTANCGACGNACRVTGSGIARCTAGRCGVLCLSGTADCDGNAANGCEVDTRTSATNCGACGRACTTGTACVGGVCTAPASRTLEDFDAVTWPRAPWSVVSGSSAGTRDAACAQGGAAGLLDPPWIYRTDLSLGATGERVSLWVRRGGSGRAYLGFGASATGGYSLVAGFNTSELLIQQNANWGYTTQATTPYTFATGVWLRLELTFNGAGAVTGTLYSAANAVLATVTATLPGLARGGVALRGFGSTCVDTLERR